MKQNASPSLAAFKVARWVLLVLSPAIFAVSCQKESVKGEGELSMVPILFEADGMDIDLEKTKVDAVTSLSSFNVTATTGTSGSETNRWNNVSFSGSTDYTGDKYWLATNPSGGYHFYAANTALTFSAGGCTISASNTMDVVCAYLASPTFQAKNKLTFNHILARIGRVTFNNNAAYNITGISVSLTPVVSGTYNLRTGAFSSTSNGSSTTLCSGSASAGGSCANSASFDLYLLPGTYTLSVNYTIPSGARSYSGEISVVAGKVNSININVDNEAEEIQIGLSLTGWTALAVNGGTVS